MDTWQKAKRIPEEKNDKYQQQTLEPMPFETSQESGEPEVMDKSGPLKLHFKGIQ